MSADNWTVCPKCNENHEIKIKALENKVEKAYGNIPFNEFESLKKELLSLAKSKLPETLREDYEIYMEDSGYFSIGYACTCSECGFSFNYEYDKNVI